MEIAYSTRGDLGVIELNAPPRNAFDAPAFADEARLRAFLSRDDLKAAVVTGRGRHFSAGADLARLEASVAGDHARLGEELDAGKRLLDAIRYADLPVVAAIRGSCLGAGLELALACHFRVAAASAILGFPEVERGLLPGLGGTLLARAGVSRGAAVDLLLRGSLVNGEEALGLKLVDEVVTGADDLAERAAAFAASIVAGRTRAQIRCVMTAAANAERLDRRSALAEETRHFLALAAEILGAREAP